MECHSWQRGGLRRAFVTLQGWLQLRESTYIIILIKIVHWLPMDNQSKL